MINKEEFKAWLQHPVTIVVREVLAKKRDRLRHEWEGGLYTDYAKDAMILTNVANLGTCKGYAFVQELDFEQLEMELDDGDERKRTESSRSGSSD